MKQVSVEWRFLFPRWSRESRKTTLLFSPCTQIIFCITFPLAWLPYRHLNTIKRPFVINSRGNWRLWNKWPDPLVALKWILLQLFQNKEQNIHPPNPPGKKYRCEICVWWNWWAQIKSFVGFFFLFFFFFAQISPSMMDFPGGSDSKASTYNAGDPGLIPGSGRSSGEGNGNPFQCSCLENPMDRGAW